MQDKLSKKFNQENRLQLLDVIRKSSFAVALILIVLIFHDLVRLTESKDLILARLCFCLILMCSFIMAKRISAHLAYSFSFIMVTVVIGMNFVFHFIIMEEEILPLEVASTAHTFSLVITLMAVSSMIPWPLWYTLFVGLISILGEFLLEDFILEQDVDKLMSISILGISVFISTAWSKISMDLRIKDFKSTLKLQESYRRLKEANEFKDILFANISHELRTPLQLILGPIGSTMKELSLSKESAKIMPVLKTVYHNAHSLLHMINDILDISKIKVKGQRLYLQKIDLLDFFEKNFENFEVAASANHITFTFQSECKTAEVYVDIKQFEKIILNLFLNALKFTEEGGKIEVTLGEINTAYLILFRDTGVGVHSSKIDYIFERFFQEDMKTKNQYQSFGIGLNLVQELIKLHEMKISVESRSKEEYPDTHGSVFKIRCPKNQSALKGKKYVQILSEEEALKGREIFDYGSLVSKNKNMRNNASKKRKRFSAGSKKPKILIIEDIPDMREYLAENLETYFSIFEAADGKEGLEKARRFLPDLIISDIMMPNMDGNEMIQKMKEEPPLQNIPVIFLTANMTPATRSRSFSMGAIDYIVKPFNIEELEAKVKNLLSFKKYIAMKEKASEEKKVRKKIEEMYRSREHFFSVLSHEMRNPISIIQMRFERYMMQVYKSRVSIPSEEIKALYEKSKMVGTQFDGILDLAKYRSGQRKIMIKETDIGRFISNFIENNHSIAKAEKIDLRFENQLTGGDMIYIDQSEIKKALQNLFTNSIKYKYSGRGEKSFIRIVTKKDAQNYIIDFQDNGLGIPEEDLPFIFEKFTQTKSNRSQVFQGKRASTGLGLNITKEAVNANGGWISVESISVDEDIKNHGATFSLKIPIGKEHLLKRADVIFVDKKPNELKKKTKERANITNKKHHILVVEDDQIMRFFLKDVLSHENYRISLAENGQVGLEFVKKASPDLIITDLQMPVMDGILMTKNIRKLKKVKKIPIIMLTNFKEESNRRKALEAGVDDYIIKPPKMKMIFKKIESLLKEKQ